MSHVRTRDRSCPRMLANSFCRDSHAADRRNKGYFRSFRTMHSSHMLREGARPEVVRDNMGHVDIRRDPESLRQERVAISRMSQPSARNSLPSRGRYDQTSRPYTRSRMRPRPGRTSPGTCQGFMGCRPAGWERQDAGHTARSCFVWPRHLQRVTYLLAYGWARLDSQVSGAGYYRYLHGPAPAEQCMTVRNCRSGPCLRTSSPLRVSTRHRRTAATWDDGESQAGGANDANGQLIRDSTHRASQSRRDCAFGCWS
jgi:hypothetical protein